MERIYLIKARVKVTSNKPHETIKPLSLSGLFIPKGKQKRHADIEKLCREHVISNLENIYPDYSYEATSIKINSHPCDFVINESKIS